MTAQPMEAQPPAADAAATESLDAALKTPAPRKKAASQRNIPKWEGDTRDRLKTAIRRFTKPLTDLVARDANEGDTRLLVTDILCAALGYDKYEDLTTEYQVRGEFADYGIRIDKQLVAFIEVKRCTQKLGPKHLRQVQSYAVNEGVEWMILTNGQTWQAYHLTGGLPVVVDLAFEVNLLGEGTAVTKADAMFYLSKEALRRRLIDQLWKERAATSARNLAAIVLSDAVVDAVRKELRRSTGYNASAARLAAVLHDEVLRPELT